MAPEKEKPTVETVQTTKLSDLLMVEVCQPIKESIDKIAFCLPHLPGGGRLCVPLTYCTPHYVCIPKFYCEPHYLCKPRIYCQPLFEGPGICTPSAGPHIPQPGDPLEALQAELAQKLTVNELTRLREEVTALKEEIAVLKKRVHGK